MADEKEIKWNGVKDMPPMAVSLGSMRINKTGNWRNLRPVIDYEKCIYCFICWKFCPEPAIDIEAAQISERIDKKPVINLDYCKGCGICAEECPVKCIDMVKEEI